MPDITFRLGGPIKAADRRAGVSKQGRPFQYRPGPVKQYQSELRDAATRRMQELGARPIDAACECEMLMVMPIPASWSAKKQMAAARGEIFPTGRPDIKNMLAIAEDSLKGIVIRDDSLFVRHHCRKIYGWSPMLQMTIRIARPLGELNRIAQAVMPEVPDNLVGQDEETVGGLFDGVPPP